MLRMTGEGGKCVSFTPVPVGSLKVRWCARNNHLFFERESTTARRQIIAISVGLLMALAGIGGAIPNPAAVYCIDSGYEYEGGDCVFPDGSRCDAWHYYCGCEPDGIGCWPGQFDCDFPC
ncbi:MAG: DUF333 domain-containing protein, partial [Planctomycetota bacterium]